MENEYYILKTPIYENCKFLGFKEYTDKYKSLGEAICGAQDKKLALTCIFKVIETQVL